MDDQQDVLGILGKNSDRSSAAQPSSDQSVLSILGQAAAPAPAKAPLASNISQPPPPLQPQSPSYTDSYRQHIDQNLTPQINAMTAQKTTGPWDDAADKRLFDTLAEREAMKQAATNPPPNHQQLTDLGSAINWAMIQHQQRGAQTGDQAEYEAARREQMKLEALKRYVAQEQAGKVPNPILHQIASQPDQPVSPDTTPWYLHGYMANLASGITGGLAGLQKIVLGTERGLGLTPTKGGIADPEKIAETERLAQVTAERGKKGVGGQIAQTIGGLAPQLPLFMAAPAGVTGSGVLGILGGAEAAGEPEQPGIGEIAKRGAMMAAPPVAGEAVRATGASRLTKALGGAATGGIVAKAAGVSPEEQLAQMGLFGAMEGMHGGETEGRGKGKAEVEAKGGTENAAPQGVEQGDRLAEHQGIPQGTDVRPHAEQVRQAEGQQAGSGGGVVGGQEVRRRGQPEIQLQAADRGQSQEIDQHLETVRHLQATGRLDKGPLEVRSVKPSELKMDQEQIQQLSPAELDKYAIDPSDHTVQELIDSYKRGDPVPPVVVRETKGGLVIEDGEHRALAASKAGIDIPAIVIRKIEANESIRESEKPSPTDSSVQRFRGGDTDFLHLTDEGKADVGERGKQIKAAGLNKDNAEIVTTPEVRGHETSKIISEELGGASIREDEGFKDQRLGDLSGKEVTPETIDQYKQHTLKHPAEPLPGGGESYTDLVDRVKPALDSAFDRARETGKAQIIVLHNKVENLVRGMEAAGEKGREPGAVDLETAVAHKDTDHAGMTEYTRDDNGNIHQREIEPDEVKPGGVYGMRHGRTPWNGPPEPVAGEKVPASQPEAGGPRYAYRVRSVGDTGINPADYPQGTSSLKQARSWVEGRTETEGKPQEIVRIDLNKLGEDGFETKPHPDGMDWYKFKQAVPEEAIEKVGEGEGERPATETAAPGADNFPTSIKQKVMEEELSRQGKAPVELPEGLQRGSKESYARTKAAVDAGERDPRMLAEEVVKKPRPLTDDETNMLAYDRARIHNAYADAYREWQDAVKSGDDFREGAAKNQMEDLQKALDTNYKAGKVSGYENSLGLSARKLLINQDYSLAAMERGIAEASGKPITDELRAKLDDIHQRLNEIVRLQDKHEAEIVRMEGDGKVAKMSADVLAERRAGRAAKRGDLQSQWSDLSKQFAKSVSKVSANPLFDPEPYAIIGKMAYNLVQRGVTRFADLVDQIHAEISQHLPGVSKREVGEAVSGYGKTSQMSQEATAKALREAKAQGKLILALEDAENKLRPLKSGLQRDKQSEIVRNLRKQVNAKMRENGIAIERTPPDPEAAQRTALERYKATVQTRIKEYQRRIDQKDFAPKQRLSTVLDPEGQRLKAQEAKVKNEYGTMRKKAELEARSTPEKVMDQAVKARRGILLTGLQTFGKLGAAATARQLFHPIEQLVGTGLRKVPGLSKIAERAPREGGPISAEAEINGLKQFWHTVVEAPQKDSQIRQVLKTGKSDIDLLHAKQGIDLPPSMWDYIGHAHSALKLPAKLAEYDRSIVYRARQAEANGLDLHNPEVQATIHAGAYNDALRDVFAQDNRLNTAFKAAQRIGETGGGWAKAGAKLSQALLPIVKVPLNIGGEVISYAPGGGIVKAAPKTIKVMLKGADKLTPEEADQVMRAYKKQGVGMGLTALGYVLGSSVGGYYNKEQEKERKPGEAGPGAIKVGPVSIPSFLLHNPALEMLQLGATLRHVHDDYQRKGKQGATVTGTYEAAKGIAGELPGVREMTGISKAMENEPGAAKYAATTTLSLLPPDLQRFARGLDAKSQSNFIQAWIDSKNAKARKPVGFMQNVEMGLPGGRQQVPLR